MTKRLIKKWVKALRSGKFKQGMGYLETVNSDNTRNNCCLGVLCRIEKVRGRKTSLYDFNEIHTEFAGDAEILTEDLLTRFGLTDADCGTLAELNDGGSSFHKIALWINNHLNVGAQDATK